MPILLILSSNADEYRKFIKRANSPNLEFVTEPADEQPVTLYGETNLALY